MQALLIGSISVLADTSELQRSAYNDAFHEAGLDWYWSRDEYRKLLQHSGGHARIEAFSERAGEKVDSATLRAHKTEIFQQMLRRGGLELRLETGQLLSDARKRGLKIAFVSNAPHENIEAVLSSFGGAEALGIDLVISERDGLPAKPAAEIYRHALAQLGVGAPDAVAIEDNVPGARAAIAAGIATYAYPNENTLEHDFGDVPHVRDLALAKAA